MHPTLALRNGTGDGGVLKQTSESELMLTLRPYSCDILGKKQKGIEDYKSPGNCDRLDRIISIKKHLQSLLWARNVFWSPMVLTLTL